MSDLVLSWPAAVAVLGTVVAITLGVIKLITFGKTKITPDDVKSEVSAVREDLKTLRENHNSLYNRVTKLEQTMSGEIKLHFAYVTEGMSRLEGKIDTFLAEMVAALAQSKKG